MIRRNTAASVTAWHIAALLPPLLAAASLRGSEMILVLAVALITTLIWDLLFAHARSESPSWHSLTTALVLTVVVPPSVPLWQFALAISFGVVLGEQVFGGRGFGFLNAAVVALAFLVFSFPDTTLSGDDRMIALASLPGIALLLYRGFLFWRLLVGLIVGFSIAHLVSHGSLPPPVTAIPLTFGVVFLVADPVAAATTQVGRILHGLLAGALTFLFSAMGGVAALVFAALITSLTAPLIDHLVILLQTRWRMGRQANV